MFYEFSLSPIYQLEPSFDQISYHYYNEYDSDNCQREMNNNITLIDNNANNTEKKNEEKKNSSISIDLNKNQNEDNFNDEDFKALADKIQYKYIPEKNPKSSGNLNTKATSLITGKKRQRSSENDRQTKQGRKKKDSNIKGKHNKYSGDNRMRKIKANFVKYINEQLNSKLKNKNIKFLKLDSKISENLKKDFNETLMKTKIKDLYLNTEISSKYRTQIKNNHDSNKKK